MNEIADVWKGVAGTGHAYDQAETLILIINWNRVISSRVQRKVCRRFSRSAPPNAIHMQSPKCLLCPMPMLMPMTEPENEIIIIKLISLRTGPATRPAAHPHKSDERTTLTRAKKDRMERKTLAAGGSNSQAKGIAKRAVSRREKTEKTVVSGKLTKALSAGNVDWLLFTRTGSSSCPQFIERLETF